MLPRDAKPERVLVALEQAGGLQKGASADVAAQTRVPEARVYGVGSFYSLLANPGVARVCSGLSCRVAKGTVEVPKGALPTSCLGRCDQAPVVLDAQRQALVAGQGAVLPHDPELPIDLGGADDGRWAALSRARAMPPAELRALVQASQLQGRGGAGFPAHVKWSAVAQGSQPVVVVNADEAEPGTFKDHQLMLRRPQRLVEGALIAAHGVGAREVFFYIRGSFVQARAQVERALAQAPLDGVAVHVHSGHGAYICGEETALLESLEGKRGMPRIKPPYPTSHGLWGRPTLIHNVETLACLPAIVQRGGAWFARLGRTEAGSKLYCLSGHVRRPGVYELPLGVSLDELVAVAGGYLGAPQAFCPGGASAGFLPMSFASTALDFGSLAAVGSMLGSAGVVVLDHSVDLAQAVAWQQRFFEDESCGQCAPCRIGCSVQRQAIERYLRSGDPAALELVADVAWEMVEGSICGLGVSASSPLTSALKHFPQAFGPRPPAEAP